MKLNIVFAGKVRNVGWVLDGGVTMTVDRRVNKVLDAVLDGRVDKPLALPFFI